MYSLYDVTVLTMTGFPIQKFPDQRMFSSSPRLIAAYHVFLRLLTPRHPPFALYSLATIKPQISLNALIRTHIKKTVLFDSTLSQTALVLTPGTCTLYIKALFYLNQTFI